MNNVLTTGQVATALRTTEPRLAELVRRGKIRPAPLIVSGRRMWQPEHVRQAAAVLGIRPNEVIEAAPADGETSK